MFPKWSVEAEGAHLIFCCGGFKGTTILKKIQVIDKILGATGSDICYNFIPRGKIAEVIPHSNGEYYGSVEIPSKVMHDGVEYTVTTIADNAFSGSVLNTITIPNCVTTIGNNAFKDCNRLTSITIPNSVTSIGYSSFDGCSYLSSVNISDLEAWCKITFNDNPLSYAHRLFLNGEEIKDLFIPNTVTSISNYAFSGCTGLTSVHIPSSVTSLGGYVFQDCTSMSSITIENGVISIGNNSFYGCIGLTSLTIPNSVTNINDDAFFGCNGLTSVIIPNSVTSIGAGAFCNCI